MGANSVEKACAAGERGGRGCGASVARRRLEGALARRFYVQVNAKTGQVRACGACLLRQYTADVPIAGQLTGTIVVSVDGSKTSEPTGLMDQIPGYFRVVSGPCTTSRGERCVGRPDGYGPSETCTIVVGGAGGVLGACGVFDMDFKPQSYHSDHSCSYETDYVLLPNSDTTGGYTRGQQNQGSKHCGSNCPVGVTLAAGDHVAWTSNKFLQGDCGVNDGGTTPRHNRCSLTGLCGAPCTMSYEGDDVRQSCNEDGQIHCYGCEDRVHNPCANGLGGGWQICFE